MTIAALILAGEDSSGVGTSLLPVAGQPLIELQARSAHSAGAKHIVVVVDAMPAGLVACFDRLRADGIIIELARDAADAADRVHPEEELIVFAGAVASREMLQSALAGGPAILAFPDTTERAHLERIDAAQRWSGLAIVRGALLRDTAQMLGDWTLGPTLLRKALQGKLPTRPADGVYPIASANDARAASRALTTDGATSSGPVERWLIGPLVRSATPALFERALPYRLLAVLPLALLAAAAIVALAGWPGIGLGLIVLAAAPRLLVEQLARLSGRSGRWPQWAREAALPALAVCLFATMWQRADPGTGWALAAWLIVALGLQPVTRDRAPWLADAQSSALLILVGLLAGQPLVGIIIALTHAVVSQYWMIRRAA